MSIIDHAERHLRALGLACCGRSSKSCSTYWSTSEVVSLQRDKALRLSDHDVAYECSDCPVCVGVEGCQDVDLVLRDGEDWRPALTAAARRAIEAVTLREGDLEQEADADGLLVEEVRAEKQAWLRRHFPRLYE